MYLKVDVESAALLVFCQSLNRYFLELLLATGPDVKLQNLVVGRRGWQVVIFMNNRRDDHRHALAPQPSVIRRTAQPPEPDSPMHFSGLSLFETAKPVVETLVPPSARSLYLPLCCKGVPFLFARVLERDPLSFLFKAAFRGPILC